MKSILFGAVALALLSGSAAIAQHDEHGNQHRGDDRHGQQHGNSGHGDNGRHNGWAQNRGGWGHNRGGQHRWNQGERMGQSDWNSARRVDYRRYHLRQPPRGYEWRQQGDQFILGAIAGGLISSIIMSSGR